MTALALSSQGGKSELPQVGYWVIPRRGNSTESATETYRPDFVRIRVKW